ncbi:flavodoxin family protein [Syntrophorhabdus aromaticivorans]|uniref:Flavodoxin family protein n=1 Tax=Syntrophorhabdus aromaticivorans TaxID=328301 RepID=A0A971M2J3_9BACT|nr:NAD(P)H-dependent oxidoreductase [Syntrophorhabdus aromaticivorans]NLW34089.1 flavodoxin family protein [Syntrophorhabdus aromaticivorans]
MQVLIMYFSKSGHTRELAEAIATGVKEVEGVKCLLKSAPDVTKEDFLASDGIIAGSPVYFGSMAAELKEVFDRLVAVRKEMGDRIGAAFATSGDQSGGKETTIISIIQALLIYGMIIVGDPLDATGHYGVACTGAPGEKTAANGRKLGRRVATLVKRLRG